MRIVELNSVFNGSTGKIMMGLADVAQNHGMEVFCCAAGNLNNDLSPMFNTYQIGTAYSRTIHAAFSYIDGNPESHSSFSTKKLIKHIEKIEPDLIHIHNIHGFFLNAKMLFSYIKKKKIPTIWTLHDCWSFTGRCPYFDILRCDSWKNGCHNCRYPNDWYPRVKKDISKKMWIKKKSWFTDIPSLTIVTPSNWLAGLVKQSYLKDYPVKVINNGIDLQIFKPTDSDFKKMHYCENKRIILGVAFDWGKRKGLDVINELANRLPSDYQIILVGTNDDNDKNVNEKIITIHRTQNQQELAQIYTAADLFINPTREDNFPTVNMESLACGTPVITFNTGGSPEMISSNVGAVVEREDIDGFEESIIRACESKDFSKRECILYAQSFNMFDRFKDYIKLYYEVLGNRYDGVAEK